MDERVEQIRLPDGRYGERRTVDDYDCDSGTGERVIERYEEPEREVSLRERVVEKRRPCVYERRVETIQDNEVVDVKVESLDPATKMELREHIALASSVKAQGASDDCDCYVTREELKDAMVAAAEEMSAGMQRIQPVVERVVERPAVEQPKVRLQSVVEEEVEESDEWGWVEWVLLAVVGVEAAWLIVNVLPHYLGA